MRQADNLLEDGHNADIEFEKASMEEDRFPDGISTFGQVDNKKAAYGRGLSLPGRSSVCFVHTVSGYI
jgi:hypothetical protein